MKRTYAVRPKTLEDLARELVKGESLEVQLALSALVAKARQVAQQQADKRRQTAQAVVDFKRSWAIVKEEG